MSDHTKKPERYTRRQFLTYQLVMEAGTPIYEAMEAVASTAIEHPEWDMDEEMTWAQWTEREDE